MYCLYSGWIFGFMVLCYFCYVIFNLLNVCDEVMMLVKFEDSDKFFFFIWLKILVELYIFCIWIFKLVSFFCFCIFFNVEDLWMSLICCWNFLGKFFMLFSLEVFFLVFLKNMLNVKLVVLVVVVVLLDERLVEYF